MGGRKALDRSVKNIRLSSAQHPDSKPDPLFPVDPKKRPPLPRRSLIKPCPGDGLTGVTAEGEHFLLPKPVPKRYPLKKPDSANVPGPDREVHRLVVCFVMPWQLRRQVVAKTSSSRESVQ